MIADGGTCGDVVRQSEAQVRTWLAAYGGPEVVLADVLCDRHAGDPTRIALRYEDATGEERTYAFAELRDLSARCAGVLSSLGVTHGDRVATLLPKSPELMITTLALWRLGATHVPLFTAFGPQAVGYRLAHSQARVVVTDGVNRPKSRRGHLRRAS